MQSTMNGRPTEATTQKVKNASSTAGIVGGISTIATWFVMSKLNLGMPAEIQGAAELVISGTIGGLATGISTWFAGYYTKPASGEGVQ